LNTSIVLLMEARFLLLQPLDRATKRNDDDVFACRFQATRA
jgi:hypothetical protein